MICVSIGRGRHRQMIAEYKHLAESGAQLVELRVDWILRPVNLKRILADRFCPVVFTCRRERDGGKWTRTEEERLILIRSAIVEGVDYIDLEDDIAGSIPRYGKTKRIVSYHNFRETPENLREIHERLSKLDADIVKIATMAHSPHDNLRILRMVREAKIPTIGLCMGEVGTPTRILCGRFGSPFTFATFHAERLLAPGQLTYKQMRDMYRYDQIGPDTDVYGVIADPVAHSLSPCVHNAGFGALGLNKVYVPFRVAREDLPSFLSNCRELGIKGLSVTIPHKETVIRYLSKMDEASERIAAVNTIDFSGPTAEGSNTDYLAIQKVVAEAVRGSNQSKPLENLTALVLGAGGVSKAAVYALQQLGARCVVSSRTEARSEELAYHFNATTAPWEERHQVKCDLVVNGTPVGMHPNVNETPFDGKHLRGSTVVFDTVYNPEQTLLIKQAREQGCQVITGIDMFVGQAALQFKIFTGQDAPLPAMRDALIRAIGPARS